MKKVKIPESKFKVGDRVKIVKSLVISSLVGNYATISRMYYEEGWKEAHIYKLDNLSKVQYGNPVFWFNEDDLELATAEKKEEPVKEAFGFKHGDLVVTHDLPTGVSSLTACRVVGYTKNSHIQYMIIEIPNCESALSIGKETAVQWEHLSGNKYWYVEPKHLTTISPSEISQTIVSHEIVGNTTYVTLSNGNKGIARCNPDDKFDAYIGLKLAAERAYDVKSEQELTYKLKFEVGKKYILNGTIYKGSIIEITSVDIYEGKIYYKIRTIKVGGTSNFRISAFEEDSPFGNSLKPYEEPQVKEVKRQAKVGEYIKLIKTVYDTPKAGDILKVDAIFNELVLVDDLAYYSYEYVVLENYKLSL